MPKNSEIEAVQGPTVNEVLHAAAKQRVSAINEADVRAILAKNGIKDLDSLIKSTLDAIRTDNNPGTAGRTTFIYTHAVYKTSAHFDKDMIKSLQDKFNIR